MKRKIVPFHRLKSIQYVIIIGALWAASDSLVSFFIPIQMQSYLNNFVLFGFLFAASSLAGALSDLILGYFSLKTRYTIYMFIGLVIAIIFSLSAMATFSIPLILWLMVLWGLYYEFIQIGIFNYVSRHKHTEEHSETFGVIYIFQNACYVIGPIIGGILIAQGKFAIYGLSLVFLILGIFLIRPLIELHKRRERPFLSYTKHQHFHIKHELKSLKRVWHMAFVMFLGIFIYNIWSSFIWTLVPIQSTIANPIIAGLTTSIFGLPEAAFEGIGGKLADRLGRRGTFALGFLTASAFTLLFGFEHILILKLLFAFTAALGFTFAYPAIMGETSSKADDHESQLGNLAGLQRIFVNAGYVIGPIVAGIFGGWVGIDFSFVLLGIIMLFFYIIMLSLMIHIEIQGRKHKVIVAEFAV